MATTEKYSIELDCPPGSPRPGDLIEGVLKDSGLTLNDFSRPSMLFGNWSWTLKADVEGNNRREKFEASRQTFKERITNLYNQDLIRYGSW